MRILILAFAAASLWAQEATKPLRLPEESALRIEKAQLELKVIEAQFETIRLTLELLKSQYAAKQAALSDAQAKAFQGAGVKPEEYTLDMEKRVFVPKGKPNAALKIVH